jgi:hypothetical protein
MPLRVFSSRLSSRAAFLVLGGIGVVGMVGQGTGCSPTTTTNPTGGASGQAGMGGNDSSSSTAGGNGGQAGSAGAAGQGGSGGALPPECTTSADCAASPKGPVCNPMTNTCVKCLPGGADDVCPPEQYCTNFNVCEVGCTDATDCQAPLICNTQENKCVGCVVDTDCAQGSICFSETCFPGCSPIQPCQPGFSCCTAQCYDLGTDLQNCGSCNNLCPEPPNATAACVDGVCGFGGCKGVFADCNMDPADGCEWNTLQDGPCACVPGTTVTCYFGAPGTENVGTCKSGIATCSASGTGNGPCVGQVLPTNEKCNGLDDDCNGSLEDPGCVACDAGTGSCNGNVGTFCPDGLSTITETCDPLMGTTCNPATGRCDGTCSYKALGTSYIGCDYFPTITANLVASTFSFAAVVSNTGASVATVTASKGNTTLGTYTVQPGAVQIIPFAWDNALKGPTSNSVLPMPGSVRVNQGAYRLRSNQPVTVYQFSPLDYQQGNTYSYSNDASLLLPTNVWTGTYRVVARHHFGGGSGFYAITAKDDNTVVNLTAAPGGGAVKSGVAGVNTNGSGMVTLNAGDVIEIVSNGGTAQDDPNDVTGTLVSANKPVQVIGGHQCIYIPYNYGYCDHLEESMFPFETLSNRFIVTAPLVPTGGSTPRIRFVRVVATKPNTTLTYDPPQAGAAATIAQAGQWIEIPNNAESFEITANEPITVAEYMVGQSAPPAQTSGDPAMALAVGKEQYRNSYLFHAPTNYTTAYVNVVAPTGANVVLDGNAVAGFTVIGNSGFGLARVSLAKINGGNHQITGNQPFGITVYGYGDYTSFWYAGGLNLTKLHD